MTIIIALTALGGLTFVLAIMLILANKKLYLFEDPRIDVVDDLLPHANCGACGYTTCREHAVADYRNLAAGALCLPYSLKRLEEDHIKLPQKYELAQHALKQEFGTTAIVGHDPRTREVIKLIHQVGPPPPTDLIRGESRNPGTV